MKVFSLSSLSSCGHLPLQTDPGKVPFLSNSLTNSGCHSRASCAPLQHPPRASIIFPACCPLLCPGSREDMGREISTSSGLASP